MISVREQAIKIIGDIIEVDTVGKGSCDGLLCANGKCGIQESAATAQKMGLEEYSFNNLLWAVRNKIIVDDCIHADVQEHSGALRDLMA